MLKKIGNTLAYTGLLFIILRLFLSQSFIEQYYSNGVFLKIASIQDFIFGILPFSVAILIIFIIGVFGVRKLFVQEHGGSFRDWVFRIFKWTIGLAGWFLFVWGFNYNRLSIEELNGFKTAPLSRVELLEETEMVTSNLIRFYEKNEEQIKSQYDFIEVDSFIPYCKQLINEIAPSLHLNPRKNITARQLKPKGLLLKFSTAGIYFPYTGECNIDYGLHPLQKPYVLLHEYSHGLGIGEEGACTFVGLIAGIRSNKAIIKYSVLLGYWKKLYRQINKVDKEKASQFRKLLPISVLNDIESIRKNSSQYPDIFPKIRNSIYGTFLKSQGIIEGLASYNRVVTLHYHYRKAHPAHEKWLIHN